MRKFGYISFICKSYLTSDALDKIFLNTPCKGLSNIYFWNIKQIKLPLCDKNFIDEQSFILALSNAYNYSSVLILKYRL